jgi:serine/threonine-protein kinase
MSQRFFRCPHCLLPHDEKQMFCPKTGRAIDRKRPTSVAPPPLEYAQKRASRERTPPPPTPPPPPPPQQVTPNAATDRSGKRELVGRTLSGKYRIKSVLGEGGMGTVYEGEHVAIGRAVAVKVLHPNQARKKDAVRRFHQEARAAGAIGHPNICEVYDFGTLDDGSPYLVMEKLVGETLADRIASEGGLPFDDVIDILIQVLSGLVAAHEKGVVHRDIKPENIFLTKRVGCPPVAKLLDFGVSKMVSPLLSGEREEDLDLTRTGMVMGTPYYMSPEQARGDRNLDARVDLWACGVIMYEALTGRRPYQAANYNALLLQILTTSPRSARELRPALPASFDAVIEKAMARSRDERYGTAAAFQRDLQQLRDRHAAAGALPLSAGELARHALFTAKPPRDLVDMAKQGGSASGNRASSRSSRSVADAARAERHDARSPIRPAAPRVGRATAPRARELPSSAPPSVPIGFEDTPSSLDIPITFSPDTPLSGEQLPILDINALDPSERNALQDVRRDERHDERSRRGDRWPPPPRPAAGRPPDPLDAPPPSTALPLPEEPEGDATEVFDHEYATSFDPESLGRRHDADATPLTARRAFRDTLKQDPLFPEDASAAIRAIQSARAERRREPEEPAEDETMVFAGAQVAAPPPPIPRAVNADDTVRMDSALEAELERARDRLTPQPFPVPRPKRS